MLKTWVVNMDWNPHRMEFMKKQLDGFGIPFERFSGIVGADYFEKGGATLRKVFSPVRSLIALRKKMTAGQLGDTLSHLAIYHKMIDGNIPAALIFEDDGILAPFFPDQVKDVEKFLDPNKPQVFLFDGYGTDISEKEAASTPETSLLRSDLFTYTISSCFFFLTFFSLRLMPRKLPFLSEKAISMPQATR